jgi:hypothetical protein
MVPAGEEIEVHGEEKNNERTKLASLKMARI